MSDVFENAPTLADGQVQEEGGFSAGYLHLDLWQNCYLSQNYFEMQ